MKKTNLTQEQKKMFDEHFGESKESVFLRAFKIAEKNIDMDAMYYVAESYFRGTGIKVNYVEAIYWIIKSETLGHPEAPVLREEIQSKASELQLASVMHRLGLEGKN
jgi:TPR repeat protein